MKQHTPGPWAKVYGAIMKDGKTICEFREHTSEAEQDLIAAAPDLLSALNLLLDKLHAHAPGLITNQHTESAITKAEMAISKAKGEA